MLASGGGATPLTKLMLARPVDGAVAVLLATESIGRRTSRAPVFITGMGSALSAHAFATRDKSRLVACETAAAMARRNAGWSDAKPDMAEVSASSIVSELLVLEAIGLAPRGQGMHVATDGAVAINRSGGAIPADPIMATGLVRLAQAAQQMGGGGGGARGLVHGAGGVAMQNNCVFTLEV